MSDGPLSGIRVLDLTGVLYGPFAAQHLGDWGAEVIKIEGLDGDVWRNIGYFRNRGMSGTFMAVNRNKRSLALDLKHEEGKSVLRRLIPDADVLITNFRPAALDRLGFGYEACRALNPGLVYAVGTGFGQDGPWAARPAIDEIAQAASGFGAAIGTDEEPAFVPSLIADKLCGVALAGAVAAALVHRERTGQGQMVEVPMIETFAAFNSIEMLGGHAFDPPIGPTGYPRVRGRGAIRTSDGWITMFPYSAKDVTAFFTAAGRPEWLAEFDTDDPVARSNQANRIQARIAEIGPSRTNAEWEELLERLDIPHASVATMAEIADQPHLREVGLFSQHDHPSEGRITQVRPVARFSETPLAIRRLPPRLGEHSREVLAEAGYSAAEIDGLLASGAIGDGLSVAANASATGGI